MHYQLQARDYVIPDPTSQTRNLQPPTAQPHCAGLKAQHQKSTLQYRLGLSDICRSTSHLPTEAKIMPERGATGAATPTAIPEERKKQHLPPKSYANAIEDPMSSALSNGTDSTQGADKVNHKENGDNKGREGGVVHSSKVLKIVNTGVPDLEEITNMKDNKKDQEKLGADRPAMERQESKQEYEAEGLDEAPKSPGRQKPRKASSKKSSNSVNSAGGNASTAEKILGTTTGTSELRSEKPNADGTVFEKVEGQKNGSKLVSIKPPADYEEQLRRDRKERPLSSGKQAGQRWQKSAIRFAPLNVPLQRRLQTCLVLFHTLCIAMSVSIFFFLCAIPLFWPLLIPYMIYCMWSTASTSGTLSHRSDFLRSLPVWSLFASYFPARLHRTEELSPTRKYIFGYHPHGIISHGAFAAFGTEALGFSQLFPGIKNTLLTLDTNFRIPIYRDYALAMGLASVSKESCENLLSKGGPNKVRTQYS